MAHSPKNLSSEAAQSMRPAQSTTIPITRSSQSMSNHVRSSGLITSAGRARRTLWVLAAVILLAAAPRLGWSQLQPDQVLFDGTFTGSCDNPGDCCQQISIIVPNGQATGTVFLHIQGDIPDNCINWTCWADQSTANYILTGSGQTAEIQFTTTSPEYNGIGPDTINLNLCAYDTCWEHFPWINWHANDLDPGGDEGQFQTGLCIDETYSACGGCDRVEAYDDGCTETLCFEHFDNDPMGSFTLQFNPPLRPCNYQTSGFGGNLPLCTPSYGITIDDPHWSDSLRNGDSDLTFYLPADSLYLEWPHCFGLCFQIPKCAIQEPTTVKVLDSYACPDGGGSFVPFSLKQADGGNAVSSDQSSEQNYPNPIDAASGFNTTIPFTTTADGTASIRIVDAKGNVILKDNEEVTYAGTHFFYFTATDLPSGTYYYQIEFPEGVVIQNKTMLVVK